MGPTLRVRPGELTADEFIRRLHDGERVLIERDDLGDARTVTIRYDGETYYCDTPTTLHRHGTEEAMRSCLRENGYCE